MKTNVKKKRIEGPRCWRHETFELLAARIMLDILSHRVDMQIELEREMNSEPMCLLLEILKHFIYFVTDSNPILLQKFKSI